MRVQADRIKKGHLKKKIHELEGELTNTVHRYLKISGWKVKSNNGPQPIWERTVRGRQYVVPEQEAKNLQIRFDERE